MAWRIVKAVACGLGSALVTAGLGIWHRSVIAVGPFEAFPLGLILALVGVFGWAVACRAAAGWMGLFAAAMGAFAAAQLTALPGPGGDLLIQADPTGFAWAVASMLAAVATALLPGRWFRSAKP
ncbi:MAG: hypothetical protein LBD77_01115 [Bifidobacteriaceae bacterium]|jgi:hypothetical protein|nr:hypothetical protein [Bifidobacteriaceae bacterium]